MVHTCSIYEVKFHLHILSSSLGHFIKFLACFKDYFINVVHFQILLWNYFLLHVHDVFIHEFSPFRIFGP